MNFLNVTIVSAFLTNVNNYRNPEKYIEYGKKILEIKMPKIIFIEENIYNKYLKDFKYNSTKFIFIKKEEMYFYKYLNKIDHKNINTSNVEKDTVEYIMVQCHKTEWVRIAINNNYFNTKQFIWIDFGIYHIFKDNHELFVECMYKLNEVHYDKIRIASGHLCNYFMENKVDIFPKIIWCFLGGIFGGNCDFLIIFADLMKQKCLYLIDNYNILPWEVNIWYLIYRDNPLLFNYYIADHDYSMIMGY